MMSTRSARPRVWLTALNRRRHANVAARNSASDGKNAFSRTATTGAMKYTAARMIDAAPHACSRRTTISPVDWTTVRS
jgi:hypothetical protein